MTIEFRRICSLEHGTTDTKPSAETSTLPDTSTATKTTQACATTRTQPMGETSLKPLKAILEAIREQADFALKQIQQSEEGRSMRWKCKDCRYVKHFTRQFHWTRLANAPDVKAFRWRSRCEPNPQTQTICFYPFNSASRAPCLTRMICSNGQVSPQLWIGSNRLRRSRAPALSVGFSSFVRRAAIDSEDAPVKINEADAPPLEFRLPGSPLGFQSQS